MGVVAGTVGVGGSSSIFSRHWPRMRQIGWEMGLRAVSRFGISVVGSRGWLDRSPENDHSSTVVP